MRCNRIRLRLAALVVESCRVVARETACAAAAAWVSVVAVAVVVVVAAVG